MKKLAIGFFVTLVTAAAGSLSAPSDWLAAGDQGRLAETTSRLRLMQEPKLEAATDTSAIVRWTTNTVDGTVVRYGVVHYGVDPRHLNQIAKSSNRWNRGLPSMSYRVQLSDLEPGLTYYYSVESTDATGASEGIHSEVHQFTTQRQP